MFCLFSCFESIIGVYQLNLKSEAPLIFFCSPISPLAKNKQTKKQLKTAKRFQNISEMLLKQSLKLN